MQRRQSQFIRPIDNHRIRARNVDATFDNRGTEQHVKTIVELIHATEIPHKPINKLQEIICDADLDYLGRSDFERIADNLRKELTEMGKITSRKEWDAIQVNFLKQHQFFTTTAIESRQKKKQENLQVVMDRLAADAYTD
jgi:predicted metal-dependent HD superfamily phosphohydrolase